MTKKQSPFRIFGVEPGKYTDESLKNAYLELIQKYPPEKHPERFEEIRAAYTTLKDSRSPYDMLAVAPLRVTGSTRTREELLGSLEVQLGIGKKKVEYKRGTLLKHLEEITNDTRN